MVTVPGGEGHGEPSAVAGAGLLSDREELQRRVRWAARLIWRSKHIVFVCLVITLVPTLLFLQQATARYTAETLLLIEAPEVRDALSERPGFRLGLNELVIRSEAELITSTTLARRVVDRLSLDGDPEFNPSLREERPLKVFLRALNPINWLVRATSTGDGDVKGQDAGTAEEMARVALVKRFLAGLQVQPRRRSYVISITYTSESREKAARIANTVAELYLVDRLEASFDEARRISSWLGDRLDGLRESVVASESAVERYRAEHQLGRKNDRQVSVTDQQLSELSSRLVIARTELAQKQARLAQVQTLLRTHGSVEATTDVLQSPLIQRLREQESTTQSEMSDALKVYGDRHPRIVGLRAELAEIRAKIGAEMEKVASSIGNEVNVSAAGVRTMERELAATRAQSNVAGEAEVRLRELERQAEADRTLYESFLGRFKREAEQERMQRANARIVSPAEIPSAPSYPKKGGVITVVIAVTLAFAVFLVFLIDHLDNAVRSSDEAEELADAPTLALVPLIRGKDIDPQAEIINKPRSALSDALRSLRTAIEIGDDADAPVVLVTSSIPKEGKTFVSLGLALMFSFNDQRVLLVDGDVHRPRMHSALGLKSGIGLAEVLNGEASLEEAVRPVADGRIDFLPAGRGENVGELIKGPEMANLLRGMLATYDRIVIDTPPVLAVPDTRIIARLAHRVIYLVRWNATPRDAIRAGLKLLRGSGVTVFGVVLSQVNQRKHASYGYGDYGQYYGKYKYYQQEE